MEYRSATSIPSESFICELTSRTQYDQLGFTPLKEIFNDTDLPKCFTPAHIDSVDVPDKWSTQQVIALAKRYGDQALRVVERAKSLGSPRLKFERREDQPNAR